MASPSSFSPRERELRSRLHSLIKRTEDFFHGSPIEMARRCGNPNCKCASSDEHRHRCLCLGQTRKGKSSTLYIPKHLEKRVRLGIESFQHALDLLEELNVEGRKRLQKAKVRTKSKTKAAGKGAAGAPGKKNPTTKPLGPS